MSESEKRKQTHTYSHAKSVCNDLINCRCPVRFMVDTTQSHATQRTSLLVVEDNSIAIFFLFFQKCSIVIWNLLFDNRAAEEEINK